jgi:hypothetical protein
MAANVTKDLTRGYRLVVDGGHRKKAKRRAAAKRYAHRAERHATRVALVESVISDAEFTPDIRPRLTGWTVS